ncbi:MAG: hypothetical protein NZ954_08560 [Thermofilaceae archaeon]|nr:hypothetical protein [Thermofilaceae archaeon]MDW8004933.1 hypothetical protein [Thermofilaceae archaeon]
MTSQSSGINEELLLNWGSRIGLAAKIENVRSSQLENLIASLDVFESKEALLITAAFALRQAERLNSGRTMARLVSQAMLDLYEKGGGKEDARRTLGFAKWVYEALGTKTIKHLKPDQVTLLELLKQLSGR